LGARGDAEEAEEIGYWVLGIGYWVLGDAGGVSSKFKVACSKFSEVLGGRCWRQFKVQSCTFNVFWILCLGSGLVFCALLRLGFGAEVLGFAAVFLMAE